MKKEPIILRIMKISVFLLSVCVLSTFAMPSASQNAKIRLYANGITIGQFINQVEKQTPYLFVYSKNEVNTDEKVNVKSGTNTVAQCLADAFGNTDTRYAFENDYIILTKRASVGSTQQKSGRKVTGKVVDAKGEPVIGATVVEKGNKSNGTITDVNGNFSLAVKEGATLEVTFVGYAPAEIRAAYGKNLMITMNESNNQLDEVVVVGYGTQRKVDLTGSVSTLNTESIQAVPAASLSNSLAGKISGVFVQQTGGGKPGVGSSISIRSVGTWNNSSPLYVIDDVVRDKYAFDGLDASEVENISILKDGASAAIYGSRAANGVVLVTTKKGKMGKPVINYIGSIGWEDATKIPDRMNAYQQASLINDYLSEQGYTADTSHDWFTDDELNYFKSNTYDWLDMAWRDPVINRHSLNVSGGNDRVRYFIGGTYYYETGSFKNLSYQKTNLRSNLEAKISKYLTASLDMSWDIRYDHKPYWRWDSDSDTMYDLYKALLFRTPMCPPYIDGKCVRQIGGTTYEEWSPMEIINSTNTGFNRKRYSTINATASLTYQVPFVEGLSLKALYNRNQGHYFIKQFCFPYTMYNFAGTGTHNHIPSSDVVGTYTRSDGNYLREEYEGSNDYQLNFGVYYNRTFRQHHINALLVYEQASGDDNDFYAYGYNYPDMTIAQLSAGESDNYYVYGSGSATGRLSYVGRVNYDYANKYLFEASFRYDGSSKFRKGKRWGFFPSASAGWRISEEDFFKDNVKFINYLKLRASVGLLGNDAVAGWQFLQKYYTTTGAVFGANASSSGIYSGSLPNKDITWEKSLSYNFGFDSQMLDNRLSFNFDLFFKHTYDILGSRIASLPTTFGASLPQENYATINGHGFEIELGWQDKIGEDLRYHIMGNFSYATNKVKKMDEAENIRPYQSIIGKNYDRALGYVSTGIIRTQADLDKLPSGYTIFGSTPTLGMMNYKDIRGADSDEPDGKIDSYDQEWIMKHTSPTTNFGLNTGIEWKGLAIDLYFQGVGGYDKMIDIRGPQTRVAENAFSFWGDHYTSENINAKYPKLWRNQNDQYSTFWRRNGTFIRLKNVNIAYNLPKAIVSKVGLGNVQIFFTGNNLCLLKNDVKYYDPETPSIRYYPLMKSYSFGINVNF
jgi:TonB-linked SusC/RagA family outer membrane protein